MLILGRRRDEKIVVQVGDVKFTIQVTDIRPGSVRLGFDMPDEVRADREEIFYAKEADRELRRQREGGAA